MRAQEQDGSLTTTLAPGKLSVSVSACAAALYSPPFALQCVVFTVETNVDEFTSAFRNLNIAPSDFVVLDYSAAKPPGKVHYKEDGFMGVDLNRQP